MSDPNVTVSALTQSFTDDDLTVQVQIYKIAGNDGWTLELFVDEENAVTWTELFATEQEAWEEFVAAVRDVGLKALIEETDDDVVTLH